MARSISAHGNGPSSLPNELLRRNYYAQAAKQRCGGAGKRQRRRSCRQPLGEAAESFENSGQVATAVTDVEPTTEATEGKTDALSAVESTPKDVESAPKEKTQVKEESTPAQVEISLVHALGSILDHMTTISPSSPETESMPGSSFQCVCPPKVSITKYLTRIHKYFHCSDECFVLALAYVDRLVKTQPLVQVTPLTCHRLMLASCVVAAKFHDDEFVSNDYYAKVGGIEASELNALEAEFLLLLDWKLFVSPREYNLYLATLYGVLRS